LLVDEAVCRHMKGAFPALNVRKNSPSPFPLRVRCEAQMKSGVGAVLGPAWKEVTGGLEKSWSGKASWFLECLVFGLMLGEDHNFSFMREIAYDHRETADGR
jgi:hypothetical protein